MQLLPSGGIWTRDRDTRSAKASPDQHQCDQGHVKGSVARAHEACLKDVQRPLIEPIDRLRDLARGHAVEDSDREPVCLRTYDTIEGQSKIQDEQRLTD